MPVGFAAGIASLGGAAMFFGDLFDPRVATLLARTSIDKMSDFLLLAIPFFLFAGRLMNTGGITERLFGFVAVLVRPVRGGLGHANVLASMFFAGMSGSATADAVGLGSIELKAMAVEGYDPRFSVGVTAASSLLSPIIPPSIVLVAYAVQAQVSVAAVFFAAVVPGLMMAATFMAYVAVQAHRHGFHKGTLASPGEIWRAFRGSVLALMTPAIILAGIYSGLFTPTEAAAVAATYALFVTTLVYREIGWARVLAELRGTLIDTAVIMLIIGFTSTLGVVLIRSGLPGDLARFFAGLTDSPAVFMFLLMVLWLSVGCFMAQTPAILILTPILLPIAQEFGVNPLYFGIVMALALTIGLLTPPVGMVLYVLARVAKIPFEQCVVGTAPFLIPLVIVLLLVTFIPGITMWLPTLIYR
jgi:tripartite ATP-independent transporter DctM subunit